jgi:hypothetical protein
MNDYEKISILIGRYSQLGDDGNPSARADLYCADGTYTAPDGTSVVGREAIRERTVLAPRSGAKGMHITTNLVLAIDGDTASGTLDFLHFRDTADGLQPNVMGRFEDRFKKVDGQWLFQSRCVAKYIKSRG